MATKKIATDDLVKKLMVNGDKPTDLIMLFGFVGEGTEDNKTMFYFDPLLKNAIEVKDEDILHSVSITKTHSAIGGTIIWLKNASTYLQTKTVNEQAPEAFFQGDIYEQYAASKQQAQNFTNHCEQTQPPVCLCQH